MKEYLFAYGTLRDTAVQEYVFQRTLEGQPDALPGYVISTKKMYGQFPVLEPGHKPEDEVHGMSYWLGAQDLLKADVYEGPAYMRIRLSLKSGRRAWVYLEKTRAEQAE